MADACFFLQEEAMTRRLEAEWALLQGRDPVPDLKAADAFLRRSIQINPRFDATISEQGELALLRARIDASHHRSPLPQLRLAQTAFQKAIHLNPKVILPYLGLARTALAAWAVPAPAGESLRQEGQAALRVLLERNPQNPRALAIKAALSLCQIRSQAHGNRNPAAQKDIRELAAILHQHPILKREFQPYLGAFSPGG